MNEIVDASLSIDKILREMKNLKRTILTLIDRKYLNIVLRYLKAITLKDLYVQYTKRSADIMLKSIIKDEELAEEIESKVNSYVSYRELAIKKIQEMIETKTDEEMIIFYKDTLNWQWNMIAKAENLSVRQCQRKYNKEISKCRTMSH